MEHVKLMGTLLHSNSNWNSSDMRTTNWK